MAFACVAAIAVLSLLPGAERPHTGAPGRLEHFVAYAGTGFLLALGYLGGRQRLVARIGLAGASGAFEILQNFIPGRSPSLFDALASTGGSALGTAVGVILTAALAWDRADGLLNADRGAAGMSQGTTDLTESAADRRLSSVNAGFGRESPDRRKKR